MGRIMRILMMFGPLIFRQYQKYQRNKSRQQTAQNTDRQSDREQHANDRDQQT